nr:hypothetical protein [Tanacetum cinerariifolium]
MKSMYDVPRGPLPPVVIREPESEKYQPFLKVLGKGKAKSDSDEESKKVVTEADEGGQSEGQAGPDPGAQAEGQTGPDAENLKLTVEEQVLLEEPASSSRTLSSLQHLSKDISFGDLFFSDKPLDVDNDKANAETKVESMVSIIIQQDMSSIPLMTSLIIDLTSRPEGALHPKLVRNLLNVVTNDMFQPWRALTTIINLCLTGKTSGFERPRAPVLQILWGVITRAHIDYAERIWEEFTQSIHTFIEDKRNLTRHTSRKKKATLIVIPSIRFTKLIIHHLQRKNKFHPIPDSPLYLPNEEPVLGKKRTLKSVAASVAEDAPAKEPQVAAEDADLQKALEEIIKRIYDVPRGSLPPVVIRESESGKYQPLPEVPEKDKTKVTEEQVAHDLLSLQKAKKKSPADQYIFQRHTSTPTGCFGHDELSYAELGQSKSKESEKVVPGVDEGGQGEGQAGPDPGAQAEGQTGSDVDREYMDLDAADVSPQPSTEKLDEGFTATAYPKVQ